MKLTFILMVVCNGEYSNEHRSSINIKLCSTKSIFEALKKEAKYESDGFEIFIVCKCAISLLLIHRAYMRDKR